jgi:hypothetical protein
MRVALFAIKVDDAACFSISRSQGLAPLSLSGYPAGLIDLIPMLLSQASFRCVK